MDPAFPLSQEGQLNSANISRKKVEDGGLLAQSLEGLCTAFIACFLIAGALLFRVGSDRLLPVF